MRFRVHARRWTTYEIECGSEQEARTVVWELEEQTGAKTPDGDGVVKVDDTLSVTL
jgi:hypothetical protein